MDNKITRLYFDGKTNKDYCMVNNAIFKTSDGNIIKIDRDETYSSVENGILSMEWRGIYIWNSDTGEQNYDIPKEVFENAELVELELEDDAPDEDYNIEITEWSTNRYDCEELEVAI